MLYYDTDMYRLTLSVLPFLLSYSQCLSLKLCPDLCFMSASFFFSLSFSVFPLLLSLYVTLSLSLSLSLSLYLSVSIFLSISLFLSPSLSPALSFSLALSFCRFSIIFHHRREAADIDIEMINPIFPVISEMTASEWV